MDRLRLTMQLAVGAVAAVALVAFLEVGADRSVFSRGRLSAGHRGVVSCADCHREPSYSSRDDACDRCHEAFRTEPIRSFGRARCVECHWAHRGDRTMPKERLQGVCLRCHGTAEVTSDGTESADLLDFHPPHRRRR